MGPRPGALLDKVRPPQMYPGLLLLPFLCALLLAAFALIPGHAGVGVALATKRGTASRPGSAVHVASRRAGVLLLAIACGLAGGGLSGSVFFALALVAAPVMDAYLPQAEAIGDGGFGGLYLGSMVLGFLGFFSLGMANLVRWLGPKGA